MTTPQELSKSVAGEVRAEMARQQKSTSQLAATLNVHQETARRKLSGNMAFTVEELGRASAWLGVRVSELLSPVCR